MVVGDLVGRGDVLVKKASKWLGVGRRVRLIDARGREFELCEVEDLPEDSPRKLRAAVFEANSHRWAKFLWSASLIVVAMTIVSLLMPLFGVVVKRFVWAIVAWNVIGALAIVVLGTIGTRRTGTRAVEECFKAGVRPACGYCLRELEVEPDGTRGCPECGGRLESGELRVESGNQVGVVRRVSRRCFAAGHSAVRML